MKDGDTVKIVGDTEDYDAIGVIRGQAEIEIGRRAYSYRIVRFDDGHEGAYADDELQVIDDTR